MKDWRTAQTCEELLVYMPDGIGNEIIKRIQREVSNVNGFVLNDITRLSEFDDKLGEQVLNVLLEYACYSQNALCIELGRKYVSFISKKWLKIHITDTVIKYFDYNDDWNYRRLLELVSMEIPEVMNEMLEINKASNQKGILECIEDYQ